MLLRLKQAQSMGRNFRRWLYVLYKHKSRATRGVAFILALHQNLSPKHLLPLLASNARHYTAHGPYALNVPKMESSRVKVNFPYFTNKSTEFLRQAYRLLKSIAQHHSLASS